MLEFCLTGLGILVFALWFLRFGIHLEENLGAIVQFFLLCLKNEIKSRLDVFLKQTKKGGKNPKQPTKKT